MSRSFSEWPTTVLIPDINLLIYAPDIRSQFHSRAKSWWEDLLNGEREVGLVWLVIRGFMRITTQRAFSDAVLATYAIEYRAELHSNDLDFARFSGFRWVNPLSG